MFLPYVCDRRTALSGSAVRDVGYLLYDLVSDRTVVGSAHSGWWSYVPFTLIPVGVLDNPEIELRTGAVTSQRLRKVAAFDTARRSSATTCLPCGIGGPVGGRPD